MYATVSVTVPVYVPATCAAVGATVAPTKTNNVLAPPTVELVAEPEGVKAVQPVVVLVPFQQPVHVAMARLFAPLVRLVGSVNVSDIGWLA